MALDFGKVKKPSKTKKKDYPKLPDPDGSARQLANALAVAEDQEKAAKAAKESIQSQLKDRARGFFFIVNQGKPDPSTGLEVEADKPVLCLFKDAYIKYEDLTPIREIIGEPATDLYFEQAFSLVLKSEKIPPAKQQEVINEVMAVLERLGCDDALEAKPFYAPTAAFKTDRHRLLTPEQNQLLEQMEAGRGLQIVSVATAKGRS